MSAMLVCNLGVISSQARCTQRWLTASLVLAFATFLIVQPAAAQDVADPLAYTPKVLQAEGYFDHNPSSWSNSIATPLSKELAILTAESALSYYGGRLAEYVAHKNYLNGNDALLQPALVGIGLARALWKGSTELAFNAAFLPFLSSQSYLLHVLLTTGALAVGAIDAFKTEYRMWQYQNAQLPMKEGLPEQLTVIIKRSETSKGHFEPATINLFWINMVQPPQNNDHEANQALNNLIQFGLRKSLAGIRLKPTYHKGELALTYQWLTHDGWLPEQEISLPESHKHLWWLDLPQMRSEPPSRTGQVADPLSPSILTAIAQQTDSLDLHNDNILSQVQELDSFSLIAQPGHFSVWMVPDFLRGLFLLNGDPMPGITLQASNTDHIPNLYTLRPYFSRPVIPTWAEQLWPLAWNAIHTLAPLGAWKMGVKHQGLINEYNVQFDNFNAAAGKYKETEHLVLKNSPSQEQLRQLKREIWKLHPDKTAPSYTALFQDVNGAAELLGDAMKKSRLWGTKTALADLFIFQPKTTHTRPGACPRIAPVARAN